MEMVSIVEFTRPAAIYRTGDQAGLPPAQAEHFIARGAARLVRANVPRVDPALTEPGPENGRRPAASSRGV
jgi:hypothetical protein